MNSLAKALEDDRATFCAIADALPNFVWLARGDGRIVFFSAPMLAYTGLSQSEALDRGLSALVYGDDLGEVFERWRDSLDTGRPFEAEFRLRRAGDETYCWFLARAKPVRGDGGAIVHWIGTATDVDAQKRATENLDFVIETSGVFANAESVEEVSGQFARIAVQRFADWCFVMLTDRRERYKVAAIAHRDPKRVRYIEQFLERYPVNADDSLDTILRTQQPVLIPRITNEQLRRSARDADHLAIMQGLGLHSAIVAPLTHGGEMFGGVIMYSAESHREFDRNDVDVLAMLASRAAARIDAMLALGRERRERRRLQFVGRAAEAVYESFDLTTAFGNLTQLVASEIADMAAVFRVEDDSAVRLVGASHRDAALDDVVRSLVGIRVMHGDAERRFVKDIQSRKPLVGTHVKPDSLTRSVWPYLSDEIAGLAPRAIVTVPLHSRGKAQGALVAYYAENGRELDSEDVALLADIGRHASVALENADVFERERRMSETLQDSLLPPSLPRVEGLSFDAVYLPSATEAQVGGDWYDAFQLEDGTTVVSAGDVTGRGADAAVIMGKVRHLLAIAPSYERDPARILDTVESVLARRYPDTIVTAFLGFIAADRKTMRFANAGHPPPLVRRDRSVEELHAEGLPLGLRHEAPAAESCTVDFEDARMLVLYTDGLTESRHDVIGGNLRLHEVVMRDALLHTHRPARFIEEACLGNAVSDDVAVLTISFESGIRWSFDAENAKAAQDARGEFVSYLRTVAQDCDAIQTAELVFGELVGNVVRHAPGAIDIDVEWTNGAPTLHVLDRGPAFKPSLHLPDDLLSESGRGLFIVRRLSKAFDVEYVPGYGNHVRVELTLRRK